MHIDHITLRTEKLSETRDFLLRVFDGLKEGRRPDVIARNIPGHWLYAGDNPIIHLIGSGRPYVAGTQIAREDYDHAALFLNGFDTFRAKLTAMALPHSVMELPDIGERRIFLQTPTGILLETVFRE